MPTNTGLERFFGLTAQDRINELKRQALVVLSEAVEEPVGGSVYPRVVDVLRRQETVAAIPWQGISGTWIEVAGLTGIVAHVKTHGKWRRDGDADASNLREGERIILLADVPATGSGNTATLFSTVTTEDRIRYDDVVYGVSTFAVVSVRARPAAGIVAALVKYSEARED